MKNIFLTLTVLNLVLEAIFNNKKFIYLSIICLVITIFSYLFEMTNIEI